MPTADPTAGLGKRERQIMNILYRHGRASVADILDNLPDPPSYSSVRGMLRYLEDKGHVRHEQDGPRYLYLPTSSKEKVKASALRHVVQTFFDGSVSSAVATLIQGGQLSNEEYERLSRLLKDSGK